MGVFFSYADNAMCVDGFITGTDLGVDIGATAICENGLYVLEQDWLNTDAELYTATCVLHLIELASQTKRYVGSLVFENVFSWYGPKKIHLFSDRTGKTLLAFPYEDGNAPDTDRPKTLAISQDFGATWRLETSPAMNLSTGVNNLYPDILMLASEGDADYSAIMHLSAENQQFSVFNAWTGNSVKRTSPNDLVVDGIGESIAAGFAIAQHKMSVTSMPYISFVRDARWHLLNMLTGKVVDTLIKVLYPESAAYLVGDARVIAPDAALFLTDMGDILTMSRGGIRKHSNPIIFNLSLKNVPPSSEVVGEYSNKTKCDVINVDGSLGNLIMANDMAYLAPTDYPWFMLSDTPAWWQGKDLCYEQVN